MKISSIRSLLYLTAKILGDVQAVVNSFKQGSFGAILKRIGRRIYGKIASRGFNFFK